MSDLNDYFNPPRIRIAAYLLARDEDCCTRPLAKHLLDWSLSLVKGGMTAQHSGDCTKESHSCIRCIADAALADADAIIALTSG